jgi:hypothetical protein
MLVPPLECTWLSKQAESANHLPGWSEYTKIDLLKTFTHSRTQSPSYALVVLGRTRVRRALGTRMAFTLHV